MCRSILGRSLFSWSMVSDLVGEFGVVWVVVLFLLVILFGFSFSLESWSFGFLFLRGGGVLVFCCAWSRANSMILFSDLSEIDCAMIWWLGVDIWFRRYG